MRNRFESFAGSILELNRCLQKIKDMEMKKFGLRGTHTMCLYYLGQHQEGLTAARLTKLCREDKSAVSRSLSQLIQKELVCCKLPEDKRSYRTLHYLTDKGRILVSKMNERIEHALMTGGRGLSEQERSGFYDTMDRILDNLSQYLQGKEELE
ncbi:MAG: MarR family transcriptional regulator [Lachnospiraceae bacterium]|nr:MarR family transcriptional regulator [Lachnospiraceae bacterium]